MNQQRYVRFQGVQISINFELDEHQNCVRKQCVECREEKNFEHFTNLKGNFLGKHNQCNVCLTKHAEQFRRSKGIAPKQPVVLTENGIRKRSCSKCQEIKSLEDFDQNPSGYLGHDSQCSNCKKKQGEVYRRNKGIKAPRKVPTLFNKDNVPTHRECTRCNNMQPLEQFNKHNGGTAYLDRHPYCKICSAERHLIAKYGITFEDKTHMHQKQNGACAICRESFALDVIHVDHCHTTGKVRGLLCSACNKALGLLKDNLERCMNMAAYLQTNAVADKHTK
jgi:hypothetical protein